MLLPVIIIGALFVAGCGSLTVVGASAKKDGGEGESPDANPPIPDGQPWDASLPPVIDGGEDGGETDGGSGDNGFETTCEITPQTVVINVPGDYSNIPQAIEAAEGGEVIQIAEGTRYEIDHPLILKEGLRLCGMGAQKPTLQFAVTLPDDSNDFTSSIVMAEASSIENLTLTAQKGYFAGIHVPDVSAILNNNIMGLTVISTKENSFLRLKNNLIITFRIAFNINSGGELVDNKIVFLYPDGGLHFNHNSYGKLRRNTFCDVDGERWLDNVVTISDEAFADLGTAEDPGRNVFTDYRGLGSAFYRRLIVNGTTNLIPSRGNYYDAGTYRQMQRHPDPFDSAANLTRIGDWHDRYDNTEYGVVDYREFGLSPSNACAGLLSQ